MADRLEGATALSLTVQPVGPIQPMRAALRSPKLAGTVAPLLLVTQLEDPAELAKSV